MRVLYDSTDEEPDTNIPDVFHIHQSFNTASKFNVTGLYAMLYYFTGYFTVESDTFFRDMLYNPVHTECQERECELRRKLLLYHKCVGSCLCIQIFKYFHCKQGTE